MAQQFYGYLRGFVADPDGEAQKKELLRWGIVEKNLFADPFSDKEENYPAFSRLGNVLREGDVVVVASMDRIGNRYEEIQKAWRYLVLECKADLVILDIPILDTRTNKALIGTLMTDIVLQLFSYMARRENDLIRQRQAEGIAIARAKGVHLGRPPRPTPEKFEEYYALWRAKQIHFSDFANKLGVTETQLKWLVRKKRKDTAAL